MFYISSSLRAFFVGNSTWNKKIKSNLFESKLKYLGFVFFFFISISILFSQTTVIYSTNGSYSWSCPAGVTSVTVECWGAGGAGGSDCFNNRSSSGGGGGAYSMSTIAVNPGTSYTVFVGAGGTPVYCSNGNAGGDSYFNSNSTVMAKGGGGGLNASTTGGSGGLASSSVGTTVYSGGNGGTGNSSGLNNRGGGGGGSSAGTAANGVNGTSGNNGLNAGGIAPTGGGSGSNGGNSGTAPVVGFSPGGGGGGAANWVGGLYSYGGSGSDGMVRLTFIMPACSGTPVPGNTLATATNLTPGASTTLSLQNYLGSGTTYQWYSNSTNSTSGGTPITGATNSYLTISQSALVTWYYWRLDGYWFTFW